MTRNAPRIHPYFDNPPNAERQALPAAAKTMAVDGLSPDPARLSRGVAQAPQRFGHKLIPAHPEGRVIRGEASVPDIDSLPDGVDSVDVFRHPRHVPVIVAAAIARDVSALRLKEGVVDHRAAAWASDDGIFALMDRCICRVRLGMMRPTG